MHSNKKERCFRCARDDERVTETAHCFLTVVPDARYQVMRCDTPHQARMIEQAPFLFVDIYIPGMYHVPVHSTLASTLGPISGEVERMLPARAYYSGASCETLSHRYDHILTEFSDSTMDTAAHSSIHFNLLHRVRGAGLPQTVLTGGRATHRHSTQHS